MKSEPTTAATPLVEDNRRIRLYDPPSLLSLNSAVVQGYVVLLSDGSKSSLNDSAVTLGFLALTEGNVLDACFGVPIASKSHDKLIKIVREAKVALADAAERRQGGFQQLAVETYLQAFCVVLRFHQRISKLNFFTMCFFYGKIYREAEKSLMDTFQGLQRAILE